MIRLPSAHLASPSSPAVGLKGLDKKLTDTYARKPGVAWKTSSKIEMVKSENIEFLCSSL